MLTRNRPPAQLDARIAGIASLVVGGPVPLVSHANPLAATRRAGANGAARTGRRY